ncbi:uro-adherence factor A-like [Schistocerca americana]|uniref:uro-adherence factor A-like n=1 Tax=Schistocerca americana TaxID=7009 RepID=UPI001F4F1340|nr:uro-adherence factor A-like [Schistocerca americana]
MYYLLTVITALSGRHLLSQQTSDACTATRALQTASFESTMTFRCTTSILSNQKKDECVASQQIISDDKTSVDTETLHCQSNDSDRQDIRDFEPPQSQTIDTESRSCEDTLPDVTKAMPKGPLSIFKQKTSILSNEKKGECVESHLIISEAETMEDREARNFESNDSDKQHIKDLEPPQSQTIDNESQTCEDTLPDVTEPMTKGPLSIFKQKTSILSNQKKGECVESHLIISETETLEDTEAHTFESNDSDKQHTRDFEPSQSQTVDNASQACEDTLPEATEAMPKGPLTSDIEAPRSQTVEIESRGCEDTLNDATETMTKGPLSIFKRIISILSNQKKGECVENHLIISETETLEDTEARNLESNVSDKQQIRDFDPSQSQTVGNESQAFEDTLPDEPEPMTKGPLSIFKRMTSILSKQKKGEGIESHLIISETETLENTEARNFESNDSDKQHTRDFDPSQSQTVDNESQACGDTLPDASEAVTKGSLSIFKQKTSILSNEKKGACGESHLIISQTKTVEETEAHTFESNDSDKQHIRDFEPTQSQTVDNGSRASEDTLPDVTEPMTKGPLSIFKRMISILSNQKQGEGIESHLIISETETLENTEARNFESNDSDKQHTRDFDPSQSQTVDNESQACGDTLPDASEAMTKGPLSIFKQKTSILSNEKKGACGESHLIISQTKTVEETEADTIESNDSDKQHIRDFEPTQSQTVDNGSRASEDTLPDVTEPMTKGPLSIFKRMISILSNQKKGEGIESHLIISETETLENTEARNFESNDSDKQHTRDFDPSQSQTVDNESQACGDTLPDASEAMTKGPLSIFKQKTSILSNEKKGACGESHLIISQTKTVEETEAHTFESNDSDKQHIRDFEPTQSQTVDNGSRASEDTLPDVTEPMTKGPLSIFKRMISILSNQKKGEGIESHLIISETETLENTEARNFESNDSDKQHTRDFDPSQSQTVDNESQACGDPLPDASEAMTKGPLSIFKQKTSILSNEKKGACGESHLIISQTKTVEETEAHTFESNDSDKQHIRDFEPTKSQTVDNGSRASEDTLPDVTEPMTKGPLSIFKRMISILSNQKKGEGIESHLIISETETLENTEARNFESNDSDKQHTRDFDPSQSQTVDNESQACGDTLPDASEAMTKGPLSIFKQKTSILSNEKKGACGESHLIISQTKTVEETEAHTFESNDSDKQHIRDFEPTKSQTVDNGSRASEDTLPDVTEPMTKGPLSIFKRMISILSNQKKGEGIESHLIISETETLENTEARNFESNDSDKQHTRDFDSSQFQTVDNESQACGDTLPDASEAMTKGPLSIFKQKTSILSNEKKGACGESHLIISQTKTVEETEAHTFESNDSDKQHIRDFEPTQSQTVDNGSRASEDTLPDVTEPMTKGPLSIFKRMKTILSNQKKGECVESHLIISGTETLEDTEAHTCESNDSDKQHIRDIEPTQSQTVDNESWACEDIQRDATEEMTKGPLSNHFAVKYGFWMKTSQKLLFMRKVKEIHGCRSL